MVAKPTGELFQVKTNKDKLTCEPVERLRLLEKAFDEVWLQNLLDQCPDVLPIEDIDERAARPLVSLGREVPTDAGSIDNLFISRSGHLVLVETKLWRNPQARREVVAQILDYAKHVRDWDYERLCAVTGADIREKVHPDADEADWIDRVNTNLTKGRMTLLIVGDGIHSQTEGLVEVLGGHPDFAFRLALVELRVYPQGDGMWLIVNSVLARTSEVERAIVTVNATNGVSVTTPVVEKSGSGRRVLSEQVLLEELQACPNGSTCASVAKALLQAASDEGLTTTWAAASFVIKTPVPGGSGKLLSLCVVQNIGTAWVWVEQLDGQLDGVLGKAAIKRVREEQIAIMKKYGGVLIKSGNQINIDLVALAGREEAFIRELAALARRIEEEHEQNTR